MKFILGSDSVSVFHNRKSYVVNRNSHIFGMVMDAIRSQDEVALDRALNMRQEINNKLAAAPNVEVRGNQLFYGDRQITGLLTTRVLEMVRLKLDISPMLKFVENLMQNPSSRAITELFGFMEACNLPVTEDGHFLAYKRVRDDYKDVHSATVDNSVGRVVSMPRNAVDEDRDRTCSYGLHFCSYDYLKHFGGSRIVVLKINPADVVSIPSDYNNSKGRCCKYEVVDELEVADNLPVVPLPDSYTDEYGDEGEVEWVAQVDGDVQVSTSGQYEVTSTAKINKVIADEIRKTFNYGAVTQAELARKYGISARQIGRILNYEAWV